MSQIFILLEGDELSSADAELAIFGSRAGSVTAVICSNNPEALVASAATLPVERVIVLTGIDFAKSSLRSVSSVLAELVKRDSPTALLVASSARGKEIAARVAVRTESGIVTDAIDVNAALEATQSIFGGSYTVSSRVTHGTSIVTMRSHCVEVTTTTSSPAVEYFDGAGYVDTQVTITSSEPAQKSARPSLAEASIVVSGGRGTDGKFELIEEFADLIGAAVGASRPVIDSGWYPHAYQVGQTGKTVSPQCYIACGISGAIQHKAGMQTAKTIIAINKDPEAPFFEIADFGIVGDLFTVLQSAIAALK